MTDRERLVELLMQGDIAAAKQGVFNCCMCRREAETIADYLLENGVIVPPVKVGERRIDDLGRIHIPKDVREPLNINYGDVLSIIVSDTSIVLRKEREKNA